VGVVGIAEAFQLCIAQARDPAEEQEVLARRRQLVEEHDVARDVVAADGPNRNAATVAQRRGDGIGSGARHDGVSLSL
jgi:hypothetical protein